MLILIYGMTVLRLTLAVIYTDQWAVHIKGGRELADDIARRHDYVNLGPIVTDYYHFQHRKVAKRSTEPSHEHHAKLLRDPNVIRAEQQELKRRVKRDLFDTRQTRYRMNDPLWPQMWYLNRGNGLDMNVQAAWNKGITGKGVVVTILDDGLEKDHPDIKNNYDALASYDVNNHDEDPQPRYDFVDSNRHGTRCAGEVAADANNSICAVGIAYEAKVGGVRMLDGDVTDAVEARSLSLNPDHIHIYSASWGPDDDGKTVDGPGELATRAFMDGILHGRNGLGSIFVWASGNGGRDHDNCNCDGYTNSIWTLSISSATENGLVPWYSEACSSTLATTYSSGSVGEKQVVTTDLHYTCTATHTGTSASAPLAAGVCALALQVNPKLTWRDMQHIVVRTARPANLKASDWQTNGAGLNVSHSFGYGLMDAAAMVELARNWTTVPQQEICEIPASHPNKLVPAKSKVILPMYVDCPMLHYLEHVQAKISMSATRRGDIQIFLKSPSGTSSCLLDTRPHDTSPAGFHNWPFMTVHNWGENPQGIWMLEIHNEGRYEATITNWNMVVYGTKGNSELIHNDATSKAGLGGDGSANGNSNSSGGGSSGVAKVNTEASSGRTGDGSVHRGNVIAVASSANLTCVTTASDSGQCLECVKDLYLWNGQCVSKCPASHFSSNTIDHRNNTSTFAKSCLRCHYTCKSCVGPNDYQCLACFGDAQLESAYCRSSDLLLRINEIRSYAFAITITAIVFGLISVALVGFFICWPKRQASRERLYSALPQISGNLLVPPREKTQLKKGFLDLEDPTEDSQDEI